MSSNDHVGIKVTVIFQWVYLFCSGVSRHVGSCATVNVLLWTDLVDELWNCASVWFIFTYVYGLCGIYFIPAGSSWANSGVMPAFCLDDKLVSFQHRIKWIFWTHSGLFHLHHVSLLSSCDCCESLQVSDSVLISRASIVLTVI